MANSDTCLALTITFQQNLPVLERERLYSLYIKSFHKILGETYYGISEHRTSSKPEQLIWNTTSEEEQQPKAASEFQEQVNV